MRLWKQFRGSYFLYSFLHDPVAMSSFVVLTVLTLSAFGAPVIAPHDPYDTTTINIMDSELPPVWMDGGDKSFTLGTDAQGRDMLSTMLYGMRISLIIGVGAVFMQAVIGIVLGLLAGYKGGKIDNFLMRMADVQLSFSTLMVAIFLSAIFQAVFGVASFERMAVPFLVLVIGIAEWPQYARTVRASVLAEKKKEYVEAARVMGLPAGRIMWRHILPNTMSPILVLSTVQVAHAIMSEAALSFLGLGMPITKPSLGSLINSGFDYIFSGSWWITMFPGFLLVLLILVINLLGDWVQDVLNPKLYKG
ncbi:peptide/nickel transport system permease protein [Desulfomicrobium macestii]|uniref:Peptide/nickel transport system permease protein n=2 Tax=Desulfomicrobium TaxID=898 RepID=A0A8G2FDZ0_DESNO|nr:MULTISPECIES: ABC transporter permease [Desulfomicrobium]MBE1425856.1 peptide/nickel transport system permease protein [Desulfomicrobium macestii]SFL62320.1 peptide/nickel transport system permease protein [Desulfomicrobium norvegicum]